MGHFMLIEQRLVKDEPIRIVSPTDPGHIRFDDVSAVGGPVPGVVWPSSNDAKEVREHVGTCSSTLPTWACLLLQIVHNQILPHPTYEVFTDLREIICGEVVVLSCCHRLLLHSDLPLVCPPDFGVKGVGGTCCVCAGLMSAQSKRDIVLKSSLQFFDDSC